MGKKIEFQDWYGCSRTFGGKTRTHFLVYLLCGLSVTEGDCGDVLEDGHLHRAVTPVQEGDEWPRVHGAIGDGATWSRHCNDNTVSHDYNHNLGV